jgi:hypothetical protein
MCISKNKTDKRKGKIKAKTIKEKKTKEKYVHSIQRVFIKQNIFSELGHSLDRCQVAPLDSAIWKELGPSFSAIKNGPSHKF